MNPTRKLASTRRGLLVLFAWFCLVSSFSLAIPVPSCPARCKCRKNEEGLLKATCTDLQWDSAVYASVRVLELKPSEADIECDVTERISSHFPQLYSVSLKNCSLVHIPANSFRNLKVLREIDLSHNSLHAIDHSLFAANTELRRINLRHNPLDLGPRRLLSSDSIREADLASCDLGRIPVGVFAGLPNLRYLSLADNRLRTIRGDSLPNGLERLNLSGNAIVNVPTLELGRLKGLREVDLSRNPVNCTCQLANSRNRIFGKGAALQKTIRCFLPAKYAGYTLTEVSKHRMCDADGRGDEHLLFNRIHSSDDGYLVGEPIGQSHGGDDFLFDVEIDRVLGHESKRRRSRSFRSVEPSKAENETALEGSGEMDVDGSGDGDGEYTESTEAKVATTEHIPPVGLVINASESSNEPDSKVKSEATVDASATELKDSDEAGSPVGTESTVTTVPATALNDSSKYSWQVESDASTVTATTESEDTDTATLLVGSETVTAASRTELRDSNKANLQNETEATETPSAIGPTSTESTLDIEKMKKDATAGLESTLGSDADNSNFSDRSISRDTSLDNSTGSVPVDSANRSSSDNVNDTVGTVAAEINDAERVSVPANDESKELPTDTPPRGDTETEPESTIASQTTIEQRARDSGQNRSANFTVGATAASVDEPRRRSSSAELSREANGATTAEQIRGGKNKSEKSANGDSYVIATLVIAAVVLVCLSVYFSQQNCRPKSWSPGEPKVNNTTELQDVSLLGPEESQPNSHLYSKKYEAEGQIAQTEKLMNGDGGGGGDHSDESNGTPIVAGDNLPQVRKSTTRVTTNYESLPKTPTIISKG